MTGMMPKLTKILMMTTNHSDRPPVNTINDGIIVSGRNLPNHTMTLQGRGKFIGSGALRPPQWRTKQELYRFVAWALVQDEIHDLPNEPGNHTLEEIIEAIKRV